MRPDGNEKRHPSTAEEHTKGVEVAPQSRT